MISVLVPWRTDNGPRERLWRFIEPLWAETPFEVIAASDDGSGPFNRAQALNRAFARSTGDTVVAYDADCLPDPAKLHGLDNAPWHHLYAELGAINAPETELVLNEQLTPAECHPHVYSFCCGIIAVRRDVWEQVGGMDERFIGWGGEDIAFLRTLAEQFGPSSEPSGRLFTLWHPVADKSGWDRNVEILEGRRS